MKLYIVHTFTRPTIKPAKSILRVQKGLGYVQPEYQSFVKRVDSIIIEFTYSLAKVTAPDFVNLQIIILNKIRFSPWPIDIRHSIPILDRSTTTAPSRPAISGALRNYRTERTAASSDMFAFCSACFFLARKVFKEIIAVFVCFKREFYRGGSLSPRFNGYLLKMLQ